MGVDGGRHTRQVRDLPCRIYATEVECAKGGGRQAEAGDDGVAGEEGYEPADKDHEGRCVQPAAEGEQSPRVVDSIRIMERVVKVGIRVP
jgi:hypothetical protein